MRAPLTFGAGRLLGRVAMVVLALAIAGCNGSTTSTAPSATATAPSTSAPSSSPSPSAIGTPSVSPTVTPTVTPSANPTTPVTVTTVVITVQGCPTGCRIFAEQDGTRELPLGMPWEISVLVRDGKATLRVPVARTKGLHFSVGCPGDVCNSSNAAPVVVLRYRGIAVGATVTDSVARTQAQASGCWIGTTEADASFSLHVTVFPDMIFDREAHSIRAWMSPQIAVIPGSWLPTYRGGLGTQDSVLC